MENETFIAKVTDVNITGLNKFLNAGAGIDVNTDNPFAYVKFSLDVDAKEYGIRGISVNIDSVAASIDWYANDDELTEAEIATLIAAGGTHYHNGKIEGSFEVNSAEYKITSEDLKFKENGQLLIDEVSIDLMNKTIEVS